MHPPERPTRAAVLAVCALGALSLLGGWLVLAGGGFHTATSKHASTTVFVEGLPALVMALLQFLTAILAFTWALRRWLAPLGASLVALGLVLGPPLVVVLRGPFGS